MKFRTLIVSIFFAGILLPGLSLAQDKVIKIPPMEEARCKCTGTLSSGGRWCNQGNGTVLDMTTCLVWLKYADWGGKRPLRNPSSCDAPGFECYNTAHTQAGLLGDGTKIFDGPEPPHVYLRDSSVIGDWRLPTKTELYGLANGDEAVRSGSMRAFVGVKDSWPYWTSSTSENVTSNAYWIQMYNGYPSTSNKELKLYVWPVRSDN